jgi:hypothetical protein
VEPTSSRAELHSLIDEHFDREELRTLCFDLAVDYDSLPAEGKRAKARELVALMERHGRLEALQEAVRRARPGLGLDFAPRRAQELQTLLLNELEPALQRAFVEFTAQVDAYLTQFTRLYRELEEWKELHNLLQDLQNSFATCRSYAFSLSRVRGPGPEIQRQQERLLYEAEVNWRPVKRILGKLRELALAVEWIDQAYDPTTGEGPEWYMELTALSKQIDESFFNSDLAHLPDQLSAFGNAVDMWLYRADKQLSQVVQQIRQLPRPSSFLVQEK